MTFTNDIVGRAQADLQRAERDALNARDKLARAEVEINDLRAFLRKLEHYAAPSAASDQAPRTRRRRGSGGKGRQLADFCIAEIRNAESRVPIADLFDAVIAAGLEIGGRDEKSNLAGYLSRDKRIDFARGEGWGIIETEGAADLLAGTAAPSFNDGGQDDEATLTPDPGDETDPFS